MSAERLVLVRGMRGTRATLDRWNLDPWPVVSGWLWRSLATAVALLAAVWVVAELSTPDATPLALPGVNTEATLADVGPLLWRNLLVLALHAMACVAGFIAGFSMPELAASRAGLSRLVHEKAGPAAIAFVVAATSFSLLTQAYALGHATATIALHTGLSPAVLLLALSLHAVPELAALFLPLAAWVMASRRGRWDELLAATFATVALALPVLLVSSLLEVFVTPRLIVALGG